MRKSLIFTIFLLVLALSFSVVALAGGDRIVDARGKDSFTEEELEALNAALAEAEERSGYKLYVYISSRGEIGYDTADDVSRIFGVDSSDDAVILHIVKNNYSDPEYGIYTSGDAEDLSDATIDRILDTEGVFHNIKSSRLYEGIAAFSKAVPKEKEQFEKNSLTAVITVSVILALAAAGTTVGVIVYKYKKKLKSPAYPLSKFASMNLDHSTDTFLGSAVTKTRVASSSGRSGGRSGGGGASFRGKR